MYSLSDYAYELPKELIARYPLPQRDASRLLVLHREQQSIQHSQFASLADWLEPNDLLILNNARVLPVRLLGSREGHTGKVEVFLLQPTEPESDPRRWSALLRPARKLSEGTLLSIPAPEHSPKAGEALAVKVLQRGEQGEGVVELQLDATSDMFPWIEAFGQMPLPPYMGRAAEASDQDRYQTIFSKVNGAQAAPTAGLHFTESVFESLDKKGIRRAELTLLVGAGTFRGVSTDDIRQHALHSEQYELPAETVEAIQQTKAQGGRVVAVGTTCVRTLESVAKDQGGTITQAQRGASDLFIYPGYQYQVVDALITNFHLPESSLLMLVAAFAGRKFILNAYEEAIRERYRFFSYGDCMLIQ